MKNFKKLLITIPVVISSVGVSFLLTQKKPVEVNASSNTHTTGFFERVTDISRIEDGDKALIVIDTYEALAWFGGNPASAIFKSDGLYFSNDKSLLFVEDSQATTFTIGYNESTGIYTFRGTMGMTSENEYDVLLAHVPYDTSTGFPAIGYYTGDRFGAYKYSTSELSNDKCQWTLSNSGNSDNNIQMTNKYTSDCSRAYSIYREAKSKSCYGETNKLQFSNYYVGDDLKLDGFYLYIPDSLYSDWQDLFYDNNKNLFYFVGDGKVKAGVTTYKVKVRGLPDEEYEIEINDPIVNPGYKYTYVTEDMLKDYRGTYLVVEQEEGTRFFNAKDPKYEDQVSNSTAVTITDGVISITNHSMIDQGLIIDKVYLNDRWVYVAKTNELFPRYYSNKFYSEYPNWSYAQRFITLEDEISEATVLTIRENKNGGITFGFVPPYDEDEFYGFSYSVSEESFYFESIDYTQNARLYKIDKNDYFDDHLADFIEIFEQETANCDETGESRRIFETGWSNIEREFNMLNEDVKGYLANLTYTHNAETPGTAAYVIDKYDFIISKYSDLNDFMDRRGAAYLNTYINVRTNMFDNTMIIPIVVIGLLTIATVGGVIIVYKKKH